jgi:tripartite-type tricarboxylate transporter receptor subunit TctC
MGEGGQERRVIDRELRRTVMLRIAAAIAALCASLCTPAAAQDAAKDYPNRAIHIVVPFPAGGPADVAARLLGQRMNEDWGQPVIVDNRPGGNTVIGALQVAKAAPDGYTLLMAIDSTLVMNQYLYKSLPYDPINDFAPITTTTKTVSVLAVSAETGPKSVKELIAKAKAAPGTLNYGAGTITAQLMGHRFHKAAGLDIVYVPFKGTPETVNGLLTGSVQIIYAANVTVNPLIESGKVRALAKLDRRTAGSVENIPTLADAAGLPDLEDMSVWLGLVAPKGTPKPIIDKLQQKVAQIMTDPAMREKSERTGAYPMISTPEEFAKFIRQEAGRWQKVLRETNIKYD